MEIKYRGLDVQRWQGKIDWRTVKTDFAILKAGGADKGMYTDPQFERNYAECKRLKIPIGAYYFTGYNFYTEAEAVAEAKHFMQIIKGKQFEYPIVVDVEAVPVMYGKENITKAVVAFCKYCEEQGAYISVYGSDIQGFVSRMDYNKLSAYDKWIARYGYKPQHTGYGIWQYKQTGQVKGIVGNVDLDYCYKEYPSIMKRTGLNRF